MSVLVTGANGHIGSAILRELLARDEGPVVALDIVPDPARLAGIAGSLDYYQADVGDMSMMLQTITRHRVRRIFHLGAMLSSQSERQHWASFRTNVEGTVQLLELAANCGVEQFFFASSRGTFGRTPDRVISDQSQQLPTHFYGWGKLYCEGIGRWYAEHRGLDFRCLRYPTIVGPDIRTAGHWAPAMIEDVLAGQPHDSRWGTSGSVGFFLHVDDAARATVELMRAPVERVPSRVYNVGGVRSATSAATLAARLQERFPGAQISLSPQRDQRHEVAYDEFRDDSARAEWGWLPEFATVDAVIDRFAARSAAAAG